MIGQNRKGRGKKSTFRSFFPRPCFVSRFRPPTFLSVSYSQEPAVGLSQSLAFRLAGLLSFDIRSRAVT